MVVFPIATFIMFFMAFLLLITLFGFHFYEKEIIIQNEVNIRLHEFYLTNITEINELFNYSNFYNNVTK